MGIEFPRTLIIVDDDRLCYRCSFKDIEHFRQTMFDCGWDEENFEEFMESGGSQSVYEVELVRQMEDFAIYTRQNVRNKGYGRYEVVDTYYRAYHNGSVYLLDEFDPEPEELKSIVFDGERVIQFDKEIEDGQLLVGKYVGTGELDTKMYITRVGNQITYEINEDWYIVVCPHKDRRHRIVGYVGEQEFKLTCPAHIGMFVFYSTRPHESQPSK